MKARLRKPIEGLEANTIYDIRITETFDRDALECWIDGNMYKVYDNFLDDFVDDFEILQPVSDTTKQAIEKLFNDYLEIEIEDHVEEYQRDSAMALHEKREELKVEMFAAVVSVLEGEQ